MTVASLAFPELPPAFSGLAIDSGRDLVVEALAAAMDGSHGAGDLFWSLASDRAAAVIVLEPDVPLSQAVQMAPTLMVAIGDALGAIGPPNLALTYRWPCTVLANGGRVGSVVIATPDSTGAQDVPRFLAVGFDIALSSDARVNQEPGLEPDMTALYEEGCGDIDRTTLIEAVARHFLSWVDGWQQDGFRAVHQAWVARAHDLDAKVEGSAGATKWSGKMIGLDEEGGLLVSQDGAVISVPLVAALRAIQ